VRTSLRTAGLLRLLVIVLGLAASGARAQGQGVAIRWETCFGEGAAPFARSFACDTNAGEERLVGSFVSLTDMSEVTGNEIVIDICTRATRCPPPLWCENTALGPCTGSAPIPAWWMFRNPGSCRMSSLTMVLTPDPEPAACPDWAYGQAVGGIGAYQIGLGGPQTARLMMVKAVPPSSAAPIAAGAEYFSFALRIRHERTVGDGACAGCEQPMAIILNSINLTTPLAENNRRLVGPLNAADSDFVIWTPVPVPTRTTTWGAVKSRFR